MNNLVIVNLNRLKDKYSIVNCVVVVVVVGLLQLLTQYIL